MGRKKGLKASKARREAGARNLANWKAENPEKAQTAAVKHGAYSQHIRHRYSDKRTREGKQLHKIMQDLIMDLGGPSEISAGQRLLLDNIRSKLIVLFQISKYVDRQESIVNDQGQLLPCLGQNFVTYSEALRRDVEALHKTAKKVPPLSYEKALELITGGKR